jgi:Zn-dependent alcohol dehydrogenase
LPAMRVTGAGDIPVTSRRQQWQQHRTWRVGVAGLAVVALGAKTGHGDEVALALQTPKRPLDRAVGAAQPLRQRRHGGVDRRVVRPLVAEQRVDELVLARGQF